MRGRAALSNAVSRFAAWQRDAADDDWPGDDQATNNAVLIGLTFDHSRSIISRNDSPDVPYAQSVNPYRGCEHGCIYCYARPSHAYLGFSAGLDFETRLIVKSQAAELLRAELAKPGYRCQPLALCGNTDAWQPIERRLKITRQILELLTECRHPVGIISKSTLIERDLDLLTDLARDGLVHIALSINTLDRELARHLEPRAAAPQRRLAILERLTQAGIPCGVMVAPIIPALNDHEAETILSAARSAGAQWADYVLLRLPGEVETLFDEWLRQHEPGRAEHVFNLLRQMRGGRHNDGRFGWRMRGEGPLAELFAHRFQLARRRLGLDQPMPALRSDLFRPPSPPHSDERQLTLF